MTPLLSLREAARALGVSSLDSEASYQTRQSYTCRRWPQGVAGTTSHRSIHCCQSEGIAMSSDADLILSFIHELGDQGFWGNIILKLQGGEVHYVYHQRGKPQA